MKKMGIAFLLLAVLILCGCQSSQFRKKSMPVLNGIIYDRDNIAVDSAIIQSNGVNSAVSDANGRFTLTNLRTLTDYHIVVTKPGYESVESILRYSTASQVLYVRMYSAVQLVNEAERSINARNWAEAESFLIRASKSGCDPTEALYLTAVISIRRDNYEEALELLESAATEADHDLFIDLFLADIYQYHVKDLPRALFRLEAFRRNRFDHEIEKRYKELTDLMKQEGPTNWRKE